MNAALQLNRNQFDYDNSQPVELPENEAERAWLDNAADDLLRGADVKFKRFGKEEQGVSHERFMEALDEFASERLQDPFLSSSALGRLLWCARRARSESGTPAGEILGPDPDEAMRNVALRLLTPLAADGVIADAEDAES